MCLNESYNKVCTGKNLPEAFPIKNDLKQGNAFITTAFQLCFRICHQECPRKSRRTGIEENTSAPGLCC
jgi:hypothetical protein